MPYAKFVHIGWKGFLLVRFQAKQPAKFLPRSPGSGEEGTALASAGPEKTRMPSPDDSGEIENGQGLPAIQAQANAFRQVREARKGELVEDYVELIDDLIRELGEARQVDIAARLGVAQPTVARMLKRLGEDGLVARKAYRGVFLTEAGRSIAAAARARHAIVEDFLVALGIDPEISRCDAEGIEHHVSDETLAVFAEFTRRTDRKHG